MKEWSCAKSVLYQPTLQVSTVSHGNAQMRKYSEAGGGQEMHDVKEVVIQPPWLHLTLVIVIVMMMMMMHILSDAEENVFIISD